MKRTRRRRYHMDQIDDPNILQDGETLRVPMRRMRATDAAPCFRPSPRRVTAADGNPVNLHRPGFRFETGGSLITEVLRDVAKDDIREAHNEYRRELTDAWRDPIRTGVGSRGSGADEDANEAQRPLKSTFKTTRAAGGTGAAATREGGSGGDRDDEGYDEKKDAMSATDAREAAYAAYDHRIQNAWRDP